MLANSSIIAAHGSPSDGAISITVTAVNHLLVLTPEAPRTLVVKSYSQLLAIHSFIYALICTHKNILQVFCVKKYVERILGPITTARGISEKNSRCPVPSAIVEP